MTIASLLLWHPSLFRASELQTVKVSQCGLTIGICCGGRECSCCSITSVMHMLCVVRLCCDHVRAFGLERGRPRNLLPRLLTVRLQREGRLLCCALLHRCA